MGNTNSVQILRRNWDCDCLYDIMTGNGFMITEPSTFQLDKKTVKSVYGARSPLYGTDFSDEQACIERYRCECGAIKGYQFKGETCPYCKTEVNSKDVNIEFTGWLSLGNHYIIAPYYYEKLASVIGKKVIAEIAIIKKQVDRDGHISRAESLDPNQAPQSPYSGIGIAEFKDRFEEIMEYFYNKKRKSPDKASAIQRLIKEKASVFVSKIPVYSTFLRPQSQTSDSYYFNSIDKEIEPLFSLCDRIKSAEAIDEYFVLSRIQLRANKLWEKNLELIKGKNGFIRGQVLGGGLNYTARNVIIPNEHLEMDEIKLSYYTFRILFKEKILYYIMKIMGVPLYKALQIWHEGHVFSEKLWQIMMMIVEREKVSCVINRNPTLNYYSILLMRVKTISRDPDDYTLGVPFFILPGLNADFDGDILNIIAMVNKEIAKSFSKFSPVTNMMISIDSGKLNEYFSLDKNQMIDLRNFCVV